MESRLCKNCGSVLTIKQTKRTPEQLQKSYYYTAYYFCTKCKKLYHDDKFKVENKDLFSTSVVPNKMRNEDFDIHIWTDGACRGNGYAHAKATWAFVSGKTEKAGLVLGKQTNNTAEAYAVYHALLWAAEEKHKIVKIYSDSKITLGNLQKSPDRIKENREIFQLIADLISAQDLTVDYEKVPGHSDNINNNRADKLANELAGISAKG